MNDSAAQLLFNTVLGLVLGLGFLALKWLVNQHLINRKDRES